MKQQRKLRGISLIVLVMNIIVMIIVSGVTIISLTNSNVINKAMQAVRLRSAGIMTTY